MPAPKTLLTPRSTRRNRVARHLSRRPHFIWPTSIAIPHPIGLEMRHDHSRRISVRRLGRSGPHRCSARSVRGQPTAARPRILAGRRTILQLEPMSSWRLGPGRSVPSWASRSARPSSAPRGLFSSRYIYWLTLRSPSGDCTTPIQGAEPAPSHLCLQIRETRRNRDPIATLHLANCNQTTAI